jgi:hypothetical protein
MGTGAGGGGGDNVSKTSMDMILDGATLTIRQKVLAAVTGKQ